MLAAEAELVATHPSQEMELVELEVAVRVQMHLLEMLHLEQQILVVVGERKVI